MQWVSLVGYSAFCTASTGVPALSGAATAVSIGCASSASSPTANGKLSAGVAALSGGAVAALPGGGTAALSLALATALIGCVSKKGRDAGWY